ncbi:hypothetical protein F4780DRAFT_750623 [Xylariomycetidae sp. FL0641]|nr:hypothetical protein F4780DRAFT_750623 [Xylariomycetidae sp. FL0641]
MSMDQVHQSASALLERMTWLIDRLGPANEVDGAVQRPKHTLGLFRSLCVDLKSLNEEYGKVTGVDRAALDVSQRGLDEEKGKVAQAKRDLDEEKGKVAQAKRDLDEEKGKVAQAKRDQDKAIGELAEIKTYLLTIPKVADYTEMEKEWKAAKASTKQALANSQQLTREKNKLKEQRDDLEKERDQEKSAKEKAEKERNEEGDQKRQATQAYEALELVYNALEQEKSSLEQEKTSLEQEKTGLEREKANLEEQNATLEGRIATLQGEITTLKSQKTAETHAKAAAEDQVTNLTVKLVDHERVQQELKTAQQKIEELEKGMITMKTQRDKAVMARPEEEEEEEEENLSESRKRQKEGRAKWRRTVNNAMDVFTRYRLVCGESLTLWPMDPKEAMLAILKIDDDVLDEYMCRLMDLPGDQWHCFDEAMYAGPDEESLVGAEGCPSHKGSGCLQIRNGKYDEDCTSGVIFCRQAK